jgi:hypothetical protein
VITVKRVPREPETYVVWLIPESVGDVASEGARGAVRAEPEDLRGMARPAGEWSAAETEMLRTIVREVEAALTECELSPSGTLAERVRRAWQEREAVARQERLEVARRKVAEEELARVRMGLP